jgi:hypothetical protein
MSNVKEMIQQKLIEQTQQLVERGGPAVFRSAGRLLLHDEPVEVRCYESPRAGETYYPLAAVLAALAYSSPHTLQDDWNEALGQPGPLPVSLHPTAEGHYTAMIAETVVLNQLMWLTDECHAVRSRWRSEAIVSPEHALRTPVPVHRGDANAACVALILDG